MKDTRDGLAIRAAQVVSSLSAEEERRWGSLLTSPYFWSHQSVITTEMLNTDALLRIAYAAAEGGDLELARQCYERGAALGDAECLQALAYMYDVGEGVAEDKPLAMKLYHKAWRRGSHAAATNIAVLYREQRKFRMMFQWCQRVATAGDGSAQLEMAKSYLTGAGVRKNQQAALRCLAIAIESNYITEYEREEAKSMLAKLSPRLV